MRAFSTTLAAGILFFSHLAAGQSDQQTCTIQCSTSAFKATGCDFSSPNSTACACASPVYSTNLTQCATTQCSLSANDVKALVADGCKGFDIAQPSSATELTGVRVGLTAAIASALGLVSFLV
ncbi:hypothetical protein DFH08DRAFT_150277 [Mycena albidolilacea]|uniref:Extracellular membrane protein CFEM domain-containing protein n=1 Tax=Mycena albidolilacea TaxID=1033008 RepID=A0AAD7A3W3_9AGAR|nr:hypothetical protein DFH08DRAFT_150277 [Mycena albidolilacea]